MTALIQDCSHRLYRLATSTSAHMLYMQVQNYKHAYLVLPFSLCAYCAQAVSVLPESSTSHVWYLQNEIRLHLCSRQSRQLNLHPHSPLGLGRCSRFVPAFVARSNLEAVITWQAVLCMLVNLRTNLHKLPSLQALCKELLEEVKWSFILHDVMSVIEDSITDVAKLDTERVCFQA